MAVSLRDRRQDGTGNLASTDAEWQARVELAACYRLFAQLGWHELISITSPRAFPGRRTSS